MLSDDASETVLADHDGHDEDGLKVDQQRFQRILKSHERMKRMLSSLQDSLDSKSFSDVSVAAFGLKLRLHRVILSTNSYFGPLLSGNWAEGASQVIDLKFEDEFITEDAFKVVVDRIYARMDTTVISDANVRNLIAAGSFFGDQELVDDCVEFVRGNVQAKNVVMYLNFADSAFRGMATEQLLDI
ncbi:hypothetical protein HK101_002719, partial [Irineochytrium annulatum]